MQQTTKNNSVIVTIKGVSFIGFSRPVAEDAPFIVGIK